MDDDRHRRSAPERRACHGADALVGPVHVAIIDGDRVRRRLVIGVGGDRSPADGDPLDAARVRGSVALIGPVHVAAGDSDTVWIALVVTAGTARAPASRPRTPRPAA